MAEDSRVVALAAVPSCRRRSRPGQRGFSLLEAVVAFAIAAMALMALYQTTGNALQRVGEAEAYGYGLLLAESLMARHDSVPVDGLALSGETGDGFRWEIRAAPMEAVGGTILSPVMLYEIRTVVRWRSGFREYHVELISVRPEAGAA